MKKKIDSTLFISSVVCLLPIILAVLLFDKLPENIPFHWNANGKPDNIAAKEIIAFVFPIVLLAFNIIVHRQVNDPIRAEAKNILKAIFKWTIAVAEMIMLPFLLMVAANQYISIIFISLIIIGLAVTISGNYLLVNNRDSIVGIKLPSAVKWKYLWILIGLLLIVLAFIVR